MTSESDPGRKPDESAGSTGVPDADFEDVNPSAGDGATAAAGDHAIKEALWPRILYMVGYGIAAYFTLYVIVFLTIVQVLVILVSRDANDDLKAFSKNLVAYLAELMNFIVYAREEKPFPFGPFPRAA